MVGMNRVVSASSLHDSFMYPPGGPQLGKKRPLAVFDTPFQGCSVEFSPFEGRRLAVATAQYFGIVGNGRQYFLEVDPNGQIRELRSFMTQEGLYDCAWNEMNENQVISASADGSLKLWDISTSDEFPVAQWAEHGEDASGVDWNVVERSTFISSSWDKTIRLWDPLRPSALSVFHGHTAWVYNALWSPSHPHRFMSCAGDGTIRIWDPSMGDREVQQIQAHEGEVLSADWDKYSEFTVFSGGVDRCIRAWDLRRPDLPIMAMYGHGYAVRRLKTSPHQPGVVASVSYDMTFRLWDIKASPVLASCDFHTEFVTGVDFDLFMPNQISTCSWDRRVCLWDFNS